MLKYLVDKHALAVDKSAYIGDSADDAIAAKECGLKFLGVKYGYGNFAQSTSSLNYISCFSEILPLL